MLSRRPYLIRGLYEWLVDSGETPHLLVDASNPDVEVPEGFVQDGRIVLNIAPGAIQGLQMGNDEFSFSARFQGQPRRVSFPPVAVIAIYGRDSGQGMLFGPEEEGDEAADASDSSEAGSSTVTGQAPSKPGRPSLKVIK